MPDQEPGSELVSAEGSAGQAQHFSTDAARALADTPDRLSEEDLAKRERRFGPDRKPMGPPLDEGGGPATLAAEDQPDVPETQVDDRLAEPAAAEATLGSRQATLGPAAHLDPSAARALAETRDRLTDQQLDEREAHFGPERKPMGPPLSDSDTTPSASAEEAGPPDVPETDVDDSTAAS